MTRSLRSAALVIAVLVAIVVVSGSAGAYVRSRTTHGVPTHWVASCVMVQPDSVGTPDLDTATTFAAIQRSVEVWPAVTSSCSYMTLKYVTPAPLQMKLDGTNAVLFRTDSWKYASVAAGITTVFYVDRPGSSDDGRILDADIELNDVNFTFDIVDPVTGPTKPARAGTDIADLENTLVHELGHLQGLDHTCKDDATPAVEVDENGNPPPACTKLSSLSPLDRLKIIEATMYNQAGPAETRKRSPEPDDVNGICNAYPKAQDPGVCGPADVGGYDGSHGCDLGQGRAAPLLVGLVLCAVAVLALRPRRRNRPVV